MIFLNPQLNDYFCGPACVQYAIKKLLNKNISQYLIADSMNLTSEGGDDYQIIKACEAFKLKAFIVERDVEKYLEDNHVVIFGWTYPGKEEEEHYSVLLEMGDEVVINDQLEQVPMRITFKRDDFMYWWKKCGEHNMTAVVVSAK